MQMTYFENNSQLIHLVNLWCTKNIEKYKAKSIFLPAGKTPEPIYKNWELEKPQWLNELDLLQMDDIYNG